MDGGSRGVSGSKETKSKPSLSLSPVRFIVLYYVFGVITNWWALNGQMVTSVLHSTLHCLLKAMEKNEIPSHKRLSILRTHFRRLFRTITASYLCSLLSEMGFVLLYSGFCSSYSHVSCSIDFVSMGWRIRLQVRINSQMCCSYCVTCWNSWHLHCYSCLP